MRGRQGLEVQSGRYAVHEVRLPSWPRWALLIRDEVHTSFEPHRDPWNPTGRHLVRKPTPQGAAGTSGARPPGTTTLRKRHPRLNQAHRRSSQRSDRRLGTRSRPLSGTEDRCGRAVSGFGDPGVCEGLRVPSVAAWAVRQLVGTLERGWSDGDSGASCGAGRRRVAAGVLSAAAVDVGGERIRTAGRRVEDEPRCTRVLGPPDGHPAWSRRTRPHRRDRARRQHVGLGSERSGPTRAGITCVRGEITRSGRNKDGLGVRHRRGRSHPGTAVGWVVVGMGRRLLWDARASGKLDRSCRGRHGSQLEVGLDGLRDHGRDSARTALCGPGAPATTDRSGAPRRDHSHPPRSGQPRTGSRSSQTARRPWRSRRMALSGPGETTTTVQ